MLVATSETSLVESRLKTAVFLERQFRLYMVWRHRLLFDTAHAPRATQRTDSVTLLLVLEGVVAIDRHVHVMTPVALVLDDSEYEHLQEGARSLRSWVIRSSRSTSACAALRCTLASARSGSRAVPNAPRSPLASPGC